VKSLDSRQAVVVLVAMKTLLLIVALWLPVVGHAAETTSPNSTLSSHDQIKADRAKYDANEKKAPSERPWDRGTDGKRPWERSEPPTK
jgi:hypothetical protein